MKIRELKKFGKKHWRAIIFIIVVADGIALAMFYRLGSLTSGLSSREISALSQGNSWHDILLNPLNMPLKISQAIIRTLDPSYGQFLARLPSVIFGVVALGSFAYILRKWYGVRTAVYGSIIFGLSAWFLHISRLAIPDVLQLAALPMLLAVFINLNRNSAREWLFTACIAILGLLLYVPGLVWFVAAVIFLARHDIADGWKDLKDWRRQTLLILIFLVVIGLLGYGFWRNPGLWRPWIGLPAQLASPLTILNNLGQVPVHIFALGPNNAELWLPRLPVLDIFATVMFAIGVYFYGRHWLAPRSRLLLGFILLGAVLTALGGTVSLSIIMPLIYLVVVAGVGYLLHEWLRVFPRNPLARGLGMLVLAAAVFLSCLYNVRAYYIAWPHHTATQAVFHHHRQDK